jgi:hypothetical protein
MWIIGPGNWAIIRTDNDKAIGRPGRGDSHGVTSCDRVTLCDLRAGHVSYVRLIIVVSRTMHSTVLAAAVLAAAAFMTQLLKERLFFKI